MLSKRWIIRFAGIAAAVAIFAAACGEVLDDSSPGAEGADTSTPKLQEPVSTGDRSGDTFVPPNPTLDQDGSVSIDNPNPDDKDDGPAPSGQVDEGVAPSEYEVVYELAKLDLARRLDIDTEAIQCRPSAIMGHI